MTGPVPEDRPEAVRAHPPERAGDPVAARAARTRAAGLTLGLPERRCPRSRAARLGGGPGGDGAERTGPSA
ncbi:hypothetical protein ACWGHM_03765 [Streptomyces sp. NPDC054904]|uniref:hypothetical protein n=1 Tax=Streptomyces sp. Isolate_45 TaxID=2950111 RepID=UPI0024820984|nr:hypothetical protein [Streptomyces sp. Isolate_45]MDA5286700.1 hypothetical protein [Streptomyces sp. Isolate_45]